jgi:hypothetical protein
MNKLTKVDRVFVPVSVNDELPKCDSQHNRCYLSKRVGILSDEGVDSTQYYKEYDKQHNFKSAGWNNEEDFGIITHWLKEQNNKYVLDEYELRKIIIDAMNTADKYDYTLQSDKEQYIKQILNNK